MTHTNFDPDFGQERGPAQRTRLHASGADLSLVLVVGTSRINRVVVSKIVEKSGLKPLSESPEMATRLLDTVFPATVILDGGPDNRDCEVVMTRLTSLRRLTNNIFPAVILLSTRKLDDADVEKLNHIDAVVAKPILPELLQPVVDLLVRRAQA